MSVKAAHENDTAPQANAFYRQALVTLQAAQVPFLVGGAYALAHYAGINRYTKDLDIFVRPGHCAHTLEVLQTAGYPTELTARHWLGKAFCDQDCIDVIFSSGNSIATVDEDWFAHAVKANVLGVTVQLCPPEEMLWSKAYIMERERYDGADMMHLLRARGAQLDWTRLLSRFGTHWRVLLSYLVLFGFVYPAEHVQVPTWVMQELLRRLQDELHNAPATSKLCQGTLLSRAQYLTAIECWGYDDARLAPPVCMAADDVACWTAAIATEEGAG
jgi:hypothetical protein